MIDDDDNGIKQQQQNVVLFRGREHLQGLLLRTFSW
jgi:hypothetical protein